MPRWLCWATLLAAGCGGETGFVLQLEGATAPVGGSYQIGVYSAGGAPIDGVAEKTVAVEVEATAAAPHQVSVALTTAAIFADSAQRTLRVRARALDEADQVVGIGDTSTLISSGGIGDTVTVTLLADPRPVGTAATAQYFTPDEDDDATFDQGVRVELTGASTFLDGLPADQGVLAWFEDGTTVTPLGQLTTGTTVSGQLETRAIDAKNGSVVITLENGGDLGSLVAPLGWELYRGSMLKAHRDGLVPVLGTDGSIDTIFELLDAATTHAGFASDFIGAEATARRHCEHVANILGPGKTDFDDSGAAEMGATGVDENGVATYLLDADAIGVIAEKAVYDPPDLGWGTIAAQAGVCSTNLVDVVAGGSGKLQDTIDAAIAIADGTNPVATNVPTLVADVNGLRGGAFAGDATGLTALCYRNRLEALTLYPLTQLP